MHWPFGDDADRNDPLTKLRIAVASPYAQWNYLVIFDHESPERPTDREAAMIASYLESYKAHWYNDGYLAKLARSPLDVDGGANGVTFRKYGTDDWAHRRRTWDRGPQFVPEPPHFSGRRGPLDLAALLDHINTSCDTVSPRWVEWKAQHPDIFGTPGGSDGHAQAG